MIRTEVAGGIVMNRSGEVALVTYPEGGWVFPKGHLDPGEDALTAAVREIYEETGIEQSALHYVRPLPTYERLGGGNKSELKRIHMFLFHTDQERLAPVDPLHPEARWVPKENVEETLTLSDDQAFFNSVEGELP